MASGSKVHEDYEERMELHLWGGGWGLCSIDPESLQSLAMVRFSGAPTTIIECNNPWDSPKGIIPFFRSTGYVYSAHDIGIYLRSKNFSGDYGLSSVQCAETVAYGQLIWEAFWLHDSNYSEIVRPFYGHRLPWLYKFWYPDRLKRQAKEILSSIYRDAEASPQSVESYVLEKAKKCVTLLSQKLGTNEFFMGTVSPTTMDAIAFSYLAVFWRVKLPHNPLKDFILSHSNLERYLARVLQRYFPPGPGKSPAVTGPSSSLVYGDDGQLIEKSKADHSFSTTQKVAVGLIASVVMFLYALKNGIVRFPGNSLTESNNPEDDEDYWE